jgi:hypothetical protein
MMENDPRQDRMNQQDLDDAALDRELDAVLAEFTAAEPRIGLEERILANLRLEQTREAQHPWWRWPAVAALAGVILVTLFVARRPGKPAQNSAAHHPPATAQTDPAQTQVADNGGSGTIQPHEAGLAKRRKPRPIPGPAKVIAPEPKLDEFPSPQPLSEQEIILTHYVRNYPEHAALIAQARTDELRRDSAEEMSEPASADNETSDSRNK